jgi:hypothetical protein
MVTETVLIKFGGGQVKDQIATYATNFPAWPKLQQFFCNELFGENGAQNCPKSQSPHAMTGN